MKPRIIKNIAPDAKIPLKKPGGKPGFRTVPTFPGNYDLLRKYFCDLSRFRLCNTIVLVSLMIVR